MAAVKVRRERRKEKKKKEEEKEEVDRVRGTCIFPCAKEMMGE